MESQLEQKTSVMRVAQEFQELIDKLNEEWEEKNGFALSTTEATLLIARKIRAVGGIKI